MKRYIITAMGELIKWVFIFGAIYLFSRIFSPYGFAKRKGVATIPAVKPAATAYLFSFVAMNYYDFIWNRTYKVWVDDKFIYGAVVGDAVSAQMSPIGPEWQNPEFYVDTDREEKWLKVGINSAEFLKKGKGNFRISKPNVARVDFAKKKWGMANIPYSGKLTIVENNNKKTELILLGRQDPEIIKQKILSR